MSIRRVVPDIAPKDIDASRAFYVDFLGLDVAMDMGWIVTLVSPSNPTAQITLLRDDGSGSLQPHVSIEVDDVVDVHRRAVAQGRKIVYPLTDEPWGVRRFFVVDPNGTVINILSHISYEQRRKLPPSGQRAGVRLGSWVFLGVGSYRAGFTTSCPCISSCARSPVRLL
jgi:catechol 2,3-dioxygenase-like lactoylglutathione lyase family enzyme